MTTLHEDIIWRSRLIEAMRLTERLEAEWEALLDRYGHIAEGDRARAIENYEAQMDLTAARIRFPLDGKGLARALDRATRHLHHQED